jgi:hypothetical protein
LALLLIVIAVFAVPAVSSGGSLSDSSSCSQWGAATPTQQAAYARLYEREHEAGLSGAVSATNIASAITQACTHAAYLGESDDVSVIAGINHQF